MEFLLNHWEKIATLIGVFVSFFAGLKTQKIENYKRASEIYSQMIGNLENDFNTRFKSLNGYVTQLEQMNTKLHSIIDKQQKDLDKYIQKYGTDI